MPSPSVSTPLSTLSGIPLGVGVRGVIALGGGPEQDGCLIGKAVDVGVDVAFVTEALCGELTPGVEAVGLAVAVGVGQVARGDSLRGVGRGVEGVAGGENPAERSSHSTVVGDVVTVLPERVAW